MCSAILNYHTFVINSANWFLNVCCCLIYHPTFCALETGVTFEQFEPTETRDRTKEKKRERKRKRKKHSSCNNENNIYWLMWIYNFNELVLWFLIFPISSLCSLIFFFLSVQMTVPVQMTVNEYVCVQFALMQPLSCSHFLEWVDRASESCGIRLEFCLDSWPVISSQYGMFMHTLPCSSYKRQIDILTT